MKLDIQNIKAIDFHSHVGSFGYLPEGVEPYYIQDVWPKPYLSWPMSQETGTMEFLVKNMARARIGISINSSFFGLVPRDYSDPITGNRQLLEDLETADPGILMWAVVDPRKKETYAQAAELLQHPKCMGIKLHPEDHIYRIVDRGGEIYEFAAKHGATIITHSGEPNSMPEDFNFFANRFPEVTTIVSHMGCGYDGAKDHHIRAIEMNEHGNLYTDTSSASSMYSELIEYAVARIGSEKILFGTDSGCYYSPCQRARIDHADITDRDKENILFRNGLRIMPQLEAVYQSL